MGAAPGNHINILSKMFPNVLFILFDPAKFSISPTPNIIIRQEMFTDEIADLYKNYKVMLISDIRESANDPDEFERQVAQNNTQQRRWVEIMKPYSSMLKFRLPFYKGTTQYFRGNIKFQAFPPKTSAETRLIILPGSSNKEIIEYSHTKHEEIMFYFNLNYRNRSFLDYNEIFGVNYDTLRTFNILKNYIYSFGLNKNKESLEVLVLGIIFEIEETLYKNEITKPKNLKCKSVGFLVKETKNTLMLATSENKYQFGAIWTIPKGCIKERKILAKNT